MDSFIVILIVVFLSTNVVFQVRGEPNSQKECSDCCKDLDSLFGKKDFNKRECENSCEIGILRDCNEFENEKLVGCEAGKAFLLNDTTIDIIDDKFLCSFGQLYELADDADGDDIIVIGGDNFEPSDIPGEPFNYALLATEIVAAIVGVLLIIVAINSYLAHKYRVKLNKLQEESEVGVPVEKATRQSFSQFFYNRDYNIVTIHKVGSDWFSKRYLHKTSSNSPTVNKLESEVPAYVREQRFGGTEHKPQERFKV